MTTSRRDFVQLSVLAGSAAGLGLVGRAGADSGKPAPAGKGLTILVLGGTGLIGPPMVRYAIERGHTVTLFNRGKTNTHLFPEVEKLHGDRNDNLGAIEAQLSQGRTWDVVIDNTASIPRWVQESAGLLKDSANLYLYTSSISAYGSISQPGVNEDTPVATIDPAEVEKVKTVKDITGANYGPLKALCEEAARQAFPDRAIIVRPGLIVGPGDYSDRFTYWPVRIHRGGEVMAPGHPTDPVQFIDCRDLGEWYVRLVEDAAVGTYNATGPASRMSIAEMLYGIRATTPTEIEFTWVDAKFLEEHEVQPWVQMTVWVPPDSEDGGLEQVSIARAKEAGLTFRPLDETTNDTLEYWNSLPTERRDNPRAGCPAELEQKTLAAWHAQQGKS